MSESRSAWPQVTLGEVCDFKYGRSLPDSARSGGDVPVFGSNGEVGRHDEALTAGPTIVIGRKGSFGEVNFSPSKCWPIDTTYYVDSTTTTADLRWLAYRLASLGLNRLNKAAAVPGLNREDAYRQRLLLPPVLEQQRIANILDKAHALRAKRRAALDQLGILNQSIFLDMFGDPITNSRAWPRKKFSTLGSLDRGVSKHRPRNAPELLGGPYPFIQTGDVANCDGYILDCAGTYSEAGLRQSKMWPAGTLCITIAANIAKTGILTFNACFPDSVVGFRAAEPGTVEFVRGWLSFLQASLEDKAPESAQKNINLKILRGLDVPVPDADLRREFARRIAAVESVKSIHRNALAELDTLLASLEHRAFRGEL